MFACEQGCVNLLDSMNPMQNLGLSVCLSVSVRALKEKGLRYRHQTLYTYTLWQSLSM